MSRKEKTCPVAPYGIYDTAVHVALLLLGTDRGNVVSDESEECEHLGDAVENLWEKMLEKVGAVFGEKLKHHGVWVQADKMQKTQGVGVTEAFPVMGGTLRH
jgi:hypothetical protein